MPKGWERTATDPKGEKLLGFVEGLNDNFDDTLIGFTGPDQLYGLGGNDKLDGGEGADKIFGGDGNDVLTGGDGQRADKDLLSGGPGDDVLVVTRGNSPGQIVDYDTSDVLDGGEGNDTADFYMFIGDHDVNLATGVATTAHKQTLRDGVGKEYVKELKSKTPLTSIENYVGADYEDKVVGSAANNRIWGNRGKDFLDGEGGNDFLYGGDHFDVLFGGEGRDVISGGWGDDWLVGGNGSDVFVYERPQEVRFNVVSSVRPVDEFGKRMPPPKDPPYSEYFHVSPKGGEDTIVDFADGDIIDLSGLAQALGKELAFIGNAAFKGKDGVYEVRYDDKIGQLQVDYNDTGAYDAKGTTGREDAGDLGINLKKAADAANFPAVTEKSLNLTKTPTSVASAPAMPSDGEAVVSIDPVGRIADAISNGGTNLVSRTPIDAAETIQQIESASAQTAEGESSSGSAADWFFLLQRSPAAQFYADVGIIELIDDHLGFSGGVVAAEPAGELYYQNELGSPETVSQLDPALAAMEMNDAALPPASESFVDGLDRRATDAASPDWLVA